MPASTDDFGPEYLAIRSSLQTEEQRERLDKVYARLNETQREIIKKVLALKPPLHALELAIRCLKNPEWMAQWRRKQFKVIKGGE